MGLSVRTRFEVFKRDDFTCRYCARKTPEVVLQVDHVVPVCDGGTDDPINLVTACWECNSGKAGVPLQAILDGEDPHERAVLLLERERQIREYNVVLKGIRERKEDQARELVDYWLEATGNEYIKNADWSWLCLELDRSAAEVIRAAMALAIAKGYAGAPTNRDFRYVAGVLRGWRADATERKHA